MNRQNALLVGLVALGALVILMPRTARQGTARAIAATSGAGKAVSASVSAALKKVESMIISDQGLRKIQFHEAWRDRAYKDIAGKWTIGWGHLILPEEMTSLVGKIVIINGQERGSVVITRAQGDALKRKDMRIAEDAVNRLVKVPLTQPSFDALVSLVYNIGSGNFQKSSVLRLLNAGDYRGAANAMLAYNKARNPKTGVLEYSQGLANRRQSEKELFESGLV